MPGRGRSSMRGRHGHSTVQDESSTEMDTSYGRCHRNDAEHEESSERLNVGPVEGLLAGQEDNATNSQTDSPTSGDHFSGQIPIIHVIPQDIHHVQKDGVIIKTEVDTDCSEDPLCQVSPSTSHTQSRCRGRKRPLFEEHMQSTGQLTAQGDSAAQNSEKQRGRERGRGRKPKRSVDSISLSLQSQLMQNDIQSEKSSVRTRSTLQQHEAESSSLSQSFAFDNDFLRSYARLIDDSWSFPDNHERAAVGSNWTAQDSYKSTADLTNQSTFPEVTFRASSSRSMLNKETVQGGQSGGRRRRAASTMKAVRSWHVPENCDRSTGLPYDSASHMAVSHQATESAFLSDGEDSAGRGRGQGRGAGRRSRRGRPPRRGGRDPASMTNTASEGDALFMEREEETFDKCLRCGEDMGLLTTYRVHLMKKHAALYSKLCPEGEVDTNAVARQIIKKLGHIDCPDCGKEFKGGQYFLYHRKWCGREDETEKCDVCGHDLKAMWMHVHKRLHAAKDREKAKANEDDGKESPTKKKRKAATEALKIMKEVTLGETGKEAEPSDRKQDIDWGVTDVEIDNDDDEDDAVEDSKSKSSKSSSRSFSQIPSDIFKEELERINKKAANEIHCNLRPSKSDWVPLPDRSAGQYYSPVRESCKFSIWSEEHKTNPMTLKWGQASCDQRQVTSFTGGRIWAAEWCPQNQLTLSRQVIALSAVTTADLVLTKSLWKGPGLMQFWDAGMLDCKAPPDCHTLELAFGIAHDFGHVLGLCWCPEGALADRPTEEHFLQRLGLLAVACSDGSVRIYSVPTIEHLFSEVSRTENCSAPIFKPQPSETLLSANSSDLGPCLSVSWQKQNGCNFIAGGFANGYVHLWHLPTTSKQLRPAHNVLAPCRIFSAHQDAVTSIDWSSSVATQFVTGGWDRSVKVWDIKSPKSFLFAMPGPSDPASTIGPVRKVILSSPSYYSLIVADELSSRLCRGHCKGFVFSDGMTDTNAWVLNCEASTLDISYSPWYNTVASGDSSGTVLLSLCRPVIFRKKIRKSTNAWKLFTMVGVDMTTADQTCSRDDSWFPITEKEASERLCIKFVDNNLKLTGDYVPGTRSATAEILEGIPFRCVTKVSINPNLQSSHWIACGTRAGFLRVIYVPLLSELSETARNYFS